MIVQVLTSTNSWFLQAKVVVPERCGDTVSFAERLSRPFSGALLRQVLGLGYNGFHVAEQDQLQASSRIYL